MPTAPPRLCTRCRIGVVTGTVCSHCGERKVKRYKQDRRKSSSARGYDRKWQKLRKAVLLSEVFCVRCKAAGFLVPAVVGHHKDEFQEVTDAARLDSENIEALCRECHEREHGRVK